MLLVSMALWGGPYDGGEGRRDLALPLLTCDSQILGYGSWRKEITEALK